MSLPPPMPENEASRLLQLAEYDLDYLAMKDEFSGLARLAALVTGTTMSHINLIDAYSQWTIGDYGLPGGLTPREETVCHYTIAQEGHFEVQDLSADDRFREKDFVTKDPLLRYYLGVPLRSQGLNIGSLCVLDKVTKNISPEKAELLDLIALEIVKRLQIRKTLLALSAKLEEAKNTQKKLAHDIRGPVGGVLGLAQIIYEQGEENSMDEVLEYTDMMQKSCSSILDLANEILSNMQPAEVPETMLSLESFRDKLDRLYAPQALNKEVTFSVYISPGAENVLLPRNRLFQISGNLISNAIKFTPHKGAVWVNLEVNPEQQALTIRVKDSGIGLDPGKISGILGGQPVSSTGTNGERGYGFGLGLVKHLLAELNGDIRISSAPNEGALFEVTMPLAVTEVPS